MISTTDNYYNKYNLISANLQSGINPCINDIIAPKYMSPRLCMCIWFIFHILAVSFHDIESNEPCLTCRTVAAELTHYNNHLCDLLIMINNSKLIVLICLVLQSYNTRGKKWDSTWHMHESRDVESWMS